MKSQINDNNIILYKSRWFMLFMFTTYSFSNAYQWIHLNIISEKVAHFWNNSLPSLQSQRDRAINWLSLVYMFAYIPLVIPAMWFLKYKGLRATSLIASFLNALGAWIKCAAVSSDGKRFPLLLTGQSICAVAQIFILGIPAHLAAVWFGANEVSTATSLGVFGNQKSNEYFLSLIAIFSIIGCDMFSSFLNFPITVLYNQFPLWRKFSSVLYCSNQSQNF